MPALKCPDVLDVGASTGALPCFASAWTVPRTHRLAPDQHLPDRTGLKVNEGHGGAVALIQRLGSAANINVHLHCLVMDGVYQCDIGGTVEFVEVGAPTGDDMYALLQGASRC